MFRISLLSLLLAFSASANAQGFDYNYLQLNYSNLDFDDINIDGDGFGLSGSYAVTSNIHVIAAYQSAGLDFGIDVNALGLGVGYNTAISPTMDMFARLSYQYIDLDVPGPGDDDDSGVGFGVGLRYAASEQLEIDAGIDYVDFGGSDGDDTAFSAGALYNFTDAFSLGLGGSWGSDTSTYTLAARIYFGK